LSRVGGFQSKNGEHLTLFLYLCSSYLAHLFAARTTQQLNINYNSISHRQNNYDIRNNGARGFT